MDMGIRKTMNEKINRWKHLVNAYPGAFGRDFAVRGQSHEGDHYRYQGHCGKGEGENIGQKKKSAGHLCQRDPVGHNQFREGKHLGGDDDKDEDQKAGEKIRPDSFMI